MKFIRILAVICVLTVLGAAVGAISAQQAPPPLQPVPAQPTQQPEPQIAPVPPQQPAQQPPQSGGSGAPNQWVSHQMNQPPPPTSERHKISQDRIDELQQLYELARKEQEAKTRKQGPVKK